MPEYKRTYMESTRQSGKFRQRLFNNAAAPWVQRGSVDHLRKLLPSKMGYRAKFGNLVVKVSPLGDPTICLPEGPPLGQE